MFSYYSNMIVDLIVHCMLHCMQWAAAVTQACNVNPQESMHAYTNFVGQEARSYT